MDENIIEETLIDQIRIDEIVALWCKNRTDNLGIYREGVDMPPPIYDDELSQWIEHKSHEINLRKVNKDRLKDFYKADNTLEIIIRDEEALKRYEKTRKWYDEWCNSEEHKNLMSNY